MLYCHDEIKEKGWKVVNNHKYMYIKIQYIVGTCMCVVSKF